MTLFSITGAALALIALLAVVLPLFRSRDEPDSGASRGELNVAVYRDQLAQISEDLRAGKLSDDQYRSARQELENRLLEDVPETSGPAAARTSVAGQALVIAIGVAVPLLAVPIYLVLGNPGLLSARQEALAHSAGGQQIDALVGRLAARLEKQPEDGEGWTMLARSYAALGRFGEASSAFARAVSLIPDQPQLLADYADTLAMARGGRLRGEPEELVGRALRVDQNNVKALALAGSIAYQNRDFAQAASYWERVQGLVPSESDFAKAIRANIAEARNLASAAENKRPRAAAPSASRAP